MTESATAKQVDDIFLDCRGRLKVRETMESRMPETGISGYRLNPDEATKRLTLMESPRFITGAPFG